MKESLSNVLVRKTVGLNKVIKLLKDPPSDRLHAPSASKGQSVKVSSSNLADSSTQSIENT